MQKFISYGKQWVDDDDIKTVVDTLKSDYLTQGPKINEFEEAICDYTGAEFCVAVSNGTAALHLAVKALDIEKGKEGLTSPISFAASANCMVYNHVRPKFVDIDKQTYCISPEKIENEINPNTEVVIPVHFAGHPCEMDDISQIAERHDIFLIEDAAHAIGSVYADGTKVGNCRYSDMTTFSFHPVKTITSGEGGAITTNDRQLYETLKTLRTHGITRDISKFKNDDNNPQGPWYYEMQTLGYNYRITDIQCALGLNQLKKLDRFIKRRREIVAAYNKAFQKEAEIITPYENTDVRSAYHIYVIQLANLDRLTVFNELRDRNLGVNVHYIPIHLQPYYAEHFGFRRGDFPIAEDYYSKAITIPLFPRMTNSDVQYVIDTVLETVERLKPN